MKVFIKKILLFLLPLFFIGLTLEPLLRNIPNEYRYKSNYLVSNSNKVTKLFLGSSRTYYGVNPEFISGTSFNAGHICQSIDLDFEIIKKYRNNWNNLKYIMIPVDYSSLFVDKSNRERFNWRKRNYNLYYDIDISSSLSENSELLSLKLKESLIKVFSYYILNENLSNWTKFGFGKFGGVSRDVSKRLSVDLSKSGRISARRHTSASRLDLDKNLHVLDSIVKFATANNIEVLFYTSPAYKTYVSNLDKEQLDLTIKTITRFADEHSNCSYVDLLEDKHFLLSDFRDADHLNQDGAKKFSLLIDGIINNIDKNKQLADNIFN
ncbi:MAG: hypothetical protein KAG37_09820 [Flavobacteriales bacterium]|nr:hypothetical protein [Flavobacteriales bacterium]